MSMELSGRTIALFFTLSRPGRAVRSRVAAADMCENPIFHEADGCGRLGPVNAVRVLFGVAQGVDRSR
jgi:hypothetical protein